MQVNELRIGNRVELKGLFLPVCSLHSDNTLRLTSREGKSIGCFSVQEIKAIPLTPEILEKAGFTVSLIGYRFYLEKTFTHVGMFSDGYAFMFEDGIKIGRGFRNLHQLQNVYFALYGEELEITL